MKEKEINTLEDFIRQMPKELPDITTKARNLYIELGKRSFYDTKYKNLMFGEENQDYNYLDKKYMKPNIIICTTLIKQYKKLLDMANIKNNINIDDYGHYSLIFYNEKGESIKTDLTRDLKNIQFKCSTSHFGKHQLSDKYLRNMDILLGYITKERGYSNEFWYILKNRLENSNLNDRCKLELTLKSLKEFGDLSKLGQTELFNMYEKFVGYCIDEKISIHFYSIIRNNIEQYFVKLNEKNREIIYKLNGSSLEFEINEEILKDDITK